MNPANTFYSVKRFIGRLRNEIRDEVSEVSYKVVSEEEAEGVLGVRLECPHLEKQRPQDTGRERANGCPFQLGRRTSFSATSCWKKVA